MTVTELKYELPEGGFFRAPTRPAEGIGGGDGRYRRMGSHLRFPEVRYLALEVKKEHESSGESLREIGKKFGLCRESVRNIVNGTHRILEELHS